jgi:hypothetical protein
VAQIWRSRDSVGLGCPAIEFSLCLLLRGGLAKRSESKMGKLVLKNEPIQCHKFEHCNFPFTSFFASWLRGRKFVNTIKKLHFMFCSWLILIPPYSIACIPWALLGGSFGESEVRRNAKF